MAIAGKVAITPKGEWNANTTYEKLDLVFYENASYVATKPSTGVSPTDETHWMLVVQSAGGAYLEAIISGATQVGNAKTLDGHGVGYFASDESVSQLSGDLNVERERINTLVSLPEGSTTADAELLDIRVGADGKTYNNAGEAVRTQINYLKSDLNNYESRVLEQSSIIGYEPMTYTIEYGCLLNDEGIIQTDANWGVTSEISVVSGETYHIKGANWGPQPTYLFYDNSNNVVGRSADFNVETINYTDVIVTAPNTATKLRVNDFAENGSYCFVGKAITFPTKKWKCKKWVCVGDSLTEVNIRTTKHYHDYVAEETGITVVNMGVSGTGYKRTEENGSAFYQRIVNVPTDADVITIFGSFNDMGVSGLNIGSPTDTGATTIAGCVNTTLDNLFAVCPLANVGIVTPCPWDIYYPNASSEMDRTNAENYVQMLIDICKLRGIPCLDLYHCSALRPWDENFRALAYTKDDGGGCHPDETGHKIMYPRFRAFLETLIF